MPIQVISNSQATARVVSSQLTALPIISTGSTGNVLTNAITGATNLGSTGSGIYSSTLNRNLQFKKISAGTGISLSANTNTIQISSSGLVTTTGNTFVVDDQALVPNTFAYKTNIDIKGTGQVTLTNGSGSIVGTGTNFLDATAGRGLSYWFAMWVKDAASNWYFIQLNTIPTNTSATILKSFSRTLIRSGALISNGNATNTAYTNSPSTFTGTTGTYDYWIVRNWSDGLYSVTIGNNSYADNFGISIGGQNVARGLTSVAIGRRSYAPGDHSVAIGLEAKALGGAGSTPSYSIGWRAESANASAMAFGTSTYATGTGSVAIGTGFDTSGSVSDKMLLSSGTGSINVSTNTTSQTAGHGAQANHSGIFAGLNHNVPSDALRTVVIGGNTIKAVSAVTDTVYMPKIRIGQGTGGALTSGSTSNDILVRNIGGEIRVRTVTSLFTGLTVNNGLTKVSNTVRLGGSLTGATVIVGSTANTLTVRANNLLTTTNPTFILTNDTDATVGVQQNSPTLLLRGRGFKTNSTSASQTTDYKIYALPVQGSANPTVNLVLAESINGAANSNVAVFSNSAGVSTLTLGVNGGIFASPGATVVSLVAGGATGTLKVNSTTTALTFGATSSTFAEIVNAGRFVATLVNNNAGVNVGTGVGTPSNAINGDLWYTTTNTTYNGRLGANVHFIVNPQSTPIVSGSIPVGTATGQVAPVTNFTYASNTLSVPGKVAATATATLAGVNVGSVAGNPSSLSNGDIWYDSTNNVLKARVNGATVTITVS